MNETSKERRDMRALAEIQRAKRLAENIFTGALIGLSVVNLICGNWLCSIVCSSMASYLIATR